MTDPHETVRRLAARTARRLHPGLTAHLRKATVTAVNTDGTIDVDLDTEPVDDVHQLGSYAAATGDHTLLLAQDGALVAIGAPGISTGTYSPTWSNLTLGAGATNTARWRHSGGLLHIAGYVELGTSPAVSGAVNATLPAGFQWVFPPSDSASTVLLTTNPVGQVSFGDTDAGVSYAGGCAMEATSSIRFLRYDASGASASRNNLSATGPFTWAVGDTIRWSLTGFATRT